MMLLKCCTQYAGKFGKSAVATRLENVNFHSSPKERQCQSMFKLPNNCIDLTHYLSRGWGPCEDQPQSWWSVDTRCTTVPSLVSPRQRNQISNCQHPLDHWKIQRVPEKHLFLLYWLCQSLWLCGSQYTVENSERDRNTRPPDLHLEKPICRSGSNS